MRYVKSDATIYIPDYDARVLLRSGQEAGKFNGPHPEVAWLDELAWFPRTGVDQVWNDLQGGLTAGTCPRCVITNTPKKGIGGIHILRRLFEEAADPANRIVVSRLRSVDNPFTDASENVRRLSGTELGRQELEGDILDDLEGALFKADWIVRGKIPAPWERKRTVVAVDPSLSKGQYSDEAGVVVACRGKDDKVYILDDLSGKATPAEWAKRAVEAADRWGASGIVVEVNIGEKEAVGPIRSVSTSILIRTVTSRTGKKVRAEEAAAYYQQHRVVHTREFMELEREMLRWDPAMSSVSPGRLDAMVFAVKDLIVDRPVATTAGHQFQTFKRTRF